MSGKNPNEEVHVILDENGAPLILEDNYQKIGQSAGLSSLDDVIKYLENSGISVDKIPRQEIREEIKKRVSNINHGNKHWILLSEPAIDWLVQHPEAVDLLKDPKYRYWYFPDELANIVGKPELGISRDTINNPSSNASKSSPVPKAKKERKERIPNFTRAGKLANDPFLDPKNVLPDETPSIRGLRENLKRTFENIQYLFKQARDPFSFRTKQQNINAVGQYLGFYRGTRGRLKEAIARHNTGRKTTPHFGTYWSLREELQNGSIDPHEFWNLPQERVDAIMSEAERYYQSIKGDKELDPELLGDKFRFSESFYHNIDSGAEVSGSGPMPIVNGLPESLGGLAYFARSQGYLDNLDDPFFSKLVSHQYQVDDQTARDYIGQLAELERNERQVLASPVGAEEEETFFRRLRSTLSQNQSARIPNPNRIGSIPEYNPKNPIYKAIFGKSVADDFQRRAANAILSLMIDAPGASRRYILERASSAEPGVEKSVLKNVYRKVRQYLSGKGVVSVNTFHGGIGQNVVDANLRAQEILGASDAAKITEYERLAEDGLVGGGVKDDDQKIAEVVKIATATFKETEEAILQGQPEFSFSNEAYSYVDPSKIGTASVGNEDSSVPMWRRLADAYFKRRPTRSAQIRKASEALIRQMTQSPGASWSYLLEKARAEEPTISKGVFNAPSHDVFAFLSDPNVGVITPDMNDPQRQRIIDANLHAKEIFGWSDEKKIEEFDRLVAQGTIEGVGGGKATPLERLNPFSAYNRKKKSLENQYKNQLETVSSLEQWLKGENDPKLREQYSSALSKEQKKLDEIVKQLEMARQGFVEWIPDIDKLKLLTKQLHKTIQETDAAIDSKGIADKDRRFSDNVQSVIDSSGSSESIFSEAGKARQKSERERRWEGSRESVLKKVLEHYPDARELYRREQNPLNSEQYSIFAKWIPRNLRELLRGDPARWILKGAEWGETTGRAFGRIRGAFSGMAAGARDGFSANASNGVFAATRGIFSGMARGAVARAASAGASGALAGGATGASIGAAAAGLLPILGPVAIAVGIIAAATMALKKLYRAANAAADKMMTFGQYDANLFAANLIHQGREFRRNIRFARGTSVSGADLIGSLDDFKDETLPLLIEWQNIKNKFLTGFVEILKPFASVLSDILEIFQTVNEKLNGIPVLGTLKKALTQTRSENQRGTAAERAIGEARDVVFNPIGSAARYGDLFYKTIQRRKYYDDVKKKELEEQKKEEREARRRENLKDAEFREREMLGVRASDFDPDRGDFTAYDIEGRQLSKKEKQRDRASELKFILRRRITADQVKEDAILRHALANYQVAVNNLAERKFMTQSEIEKINAPHGLEGKWNAIAGLANGEPVTKEAQKNLQKIALDGGKEVRKAGAQLEAKGKLAQTFLETGEIDAEQIKQMHSLNFFHNLGYYHKKYQKEFTENREEAEAAAKYAEIKNGATPLDVKNNDMTELLTTLRGSLAAQQLANERLAAIVNNTKDTAENTEEKDTDNKKEHDFIFKFMETQSKEPINVPEGFEQSQYGRFAGETRQLKRAQKWGLRNHDANPKE